MNKYNVTVRVRYNDQRINIHMEDVEAPDIKIAMKKARAKARNLLWVKAVEVEEVR